jgi:hypothetical protein
MALHTSVTFIESFPEFAKAPVALLNAKLAEASRQVDQATWGDKAIDGHGYLTAHLLALSPFGNTAKLTQDSSTTYETHYRRLLGIVACGIRNT